MLTKQIMIFGGRDERRRLIKSNASFAVRLAVIICGNLLVLTNTCAPIRENERENERIVCCVSALTGGAALVSGLIT